MTDSNAIETGVTPLGLFFVFLSSLSSTWGVFLQKIAQNQRLALEEEYKEMSSEEVESEDAQREYRRRVRCAVLIWVCGLTLLIVVSFPLDTVSMNIMGQAMVMPLLAGLQVVENSLFAPFVLGESFDKFYDGIGTALICIGVLFIVLFGPGSPFGSDPLPALPQSYQELRSLLGVKLSATAFIVFETLVVCLLTVCLALYKVESMAAYSSTMAAYICGFCQGQQQAFVRQYGGFNFKFIIQINALMPC